MSEMYLFQGHNTAGKDTTTLVDRMKVTLARGERRGELAGKAGGSCVHDVSRPCRFGFRAGSDGRSNRDKNWAGLSSVQTRKSVFTVLVMMSWAVTVSVQGPVTDVW
jgi:hypothetical protein